MLPEFPTRQIRSMVIAFRIVPLRSRNRLSDPIATFFAENKKIPVKAHCSRPNRDQLENGSETNGGGVSP
jgi:hypothetical protein